MDEDTLVKEAVSRAAKAIDQRPEKLSDLHEEDLRQGIYDELIDHRPGLVRKEKRLPLRSFQGVGGFDLMVNNQSGGTPSLLAEVKWSYVSRPKIFEAVWDAVKLCLAESELGVSRCYLITGAPDDQWIEAESKELFESGTLSFMDLWNQSLRPPGPNGGQTVGEDLLFGGRGNRFTKAPKEVLVEEICEVNLRPESERWSVKVVAVRPGDVWHEDFAPAPLFPAVITQSWLDREVPSMDGEVFEELLVWLGHKRWKRADLDARVMPLRQKDEASDT